MKKSMLVSLLLCVVAILSPGESTATYCDQYMGDNSIYGGVTSSLNPNVLIIVDTSGSMGDTVPGTPAAYVPATKYNEVKACRDSGGSKVKCSENKIYKKNVSSGRWVDDGYSLSSVTTSCNGANPKDEGKPITKPVKVTMRTHKP